MHVLIVVEVIRPLWDQGAGSTGRFQVGGIGGLKRGLMGSSRSIDLAMLIKEFRSMFYELAKKLEIEGRASQATGLFGQFQKKKETVTLIGSADGSAQQCNELKES